MKNVVLISSIFFLLSCQDNKIDCDNFTGWQRGGKIPELRLLYRVDLDENKIYLNRENIDISSLNERLHMYRNLNPSPFYILSFKPVTNERVFFK